VAKKQQNSNKTALTRPRNMKRFILRFGLDDYCRIFSIKDKESAHQAPDFDNPGQ